MASRIGFSFISEICRAARCDAKPETLARRQIPRMRVGIDQHQQPNLFPTIGQALGHFQCH